MGLNFLHSIIGFCFLLPFTFSQETHCTLYEEKDGLIVIEMENLPLSEDWIIDSTVSDYLGSGYIVWTGLEAFNGIGNGPIQLKVKINTPGIYRFNWRVAIGKGTETSEHNDTWLKLEGANFYGSKTGSQVQPVPDCRRTDDFRCPNGSSTTGFFKIYGGEINRFEWQATTSDNDPHNINVQYDTAGAYTIDLRARSSFQCIDRMVLYKIGDVTSVDAQSRSQPASQCLDFLTNNQGIRSKPVEINIFPNPAKNQLNFIHQLSGKLEINIYAMDGTLQKSLTVYNQNFTTDIASLAAGSYLVRMQTNNMQQSEIINIIR